MKIQQFPAESGCKDNDLTRYKVDTARRVLIEVPLQLQGLKYVMPIFLDLEKVFAYNV